MEILVQCASLLRRCGYGVETRELLGSTTVYFEDDSLLGFVWVDAIDEIIAEWQTVQDEFLRANSSKLRTSLLKTWNLYMVCLSDAKATPAQQTAFSSIQEDFRGARKIAQSGIASESQLLRALYPLVPIQNLVSLESEDPISKVRGRLQQLPAIAVDTLVKGDLPREIALQEFLRAHDIKAD